MSIVQDLYSDFKKCLRKSMERGHPEYPGNSLGNEISHWLSESACSQNSSSSNQTRHNATRSRWLSLAPLPLCSQNSLSVSQESYNASRTQAGRQFGRHPFALSGRG